MLIQNNGQYSNCSPVWRMFQSLTINLRLLIDSILRSFAVRRLIYDQTYTKMAYQAQYW